MVIILDGKKEAEKILNKLKKEVSKLKQKPRLVAIQVGQNKASEVYLRIKEKKAMDVGINFKKYDFEEKIQEEKLINLIKKLNKNKRVSGIMVQLPLPKNFDVNNILNHISPEKDVDGLTSQNLGNVLKNDKGVYPATPKGILTLINQYKINLKGKKITIINHSNILGKPLALMLMNQNATVTVCHEYTKNLKKETASSDIIIVGVGKEKLITEDMIKKNAIVIDAGIVKTERGITGDVDFEKVKLKAKMITPVPGGVGPMTVASLLENTMELNKKMKK